MGTGESPMEREYPAAADLEGGDGAEAGAGMRIADVQLRGIGRAELRTDRAQTLCGEGRPGAATRRPSNRTAETVDQRRVVAGADESITGGVEQHVADTRTLPAPGRSCPGAGAAGRRG